MDERHALTAAIIANPDDDVPRLVYADWLDEHGEPDRAEFVRAQCELARLAEGDPRREELTGRAEEIERANAARWLGPLDPLLRPHSVSFNRGIIQSVIVPIEEFVRPAFQAAAAEVFPAVGVWDLGLLHSFTPRRLLSGMVRSLFVGHLGLFVPTPEAVVRQAFDSPALGWVSSLQLWGDATSDRSLDLLRASPHLRRLTGLFLHEPKCSDAGLTALARSSAVPNLQQLHLSVTTSWLGSTAAGVRAIVGSDRLPRFCKLGLSGGLPARFRLGDLFADPAVARLRFLQLGAADSFAIVAGSRHLTGLEVVQFIGREITIADREAEEFLDNPALGAVEKVSLIATNRDRVHLSPATEARFRDRFGDGFHVSFSPVAA